LESGTDVSEALAALLTKPSGRGRTKVVLAAQSATGFSNPHADVVPDRELPRRIREATTPVCVVAVTKVNPTLLRALREHPPQLLLVCGPSDPETLAQLADLDGEASTQVLGPNAVLRLGDGQTVLCAPDEDELDRLAEATGPYRVAISPTPRWLPSWLSTPELGECAAIGYVPWAALHRGWSDWIRGSDPRHVLVPLGVVRAPIDRPREPDLERAAAAHALERVTGPVFPAPRVLAAVARGLGSESLPPTELSPPEHALWQQARRALPSVGARLGMEEPDPSTPAAVATAAFLAQRALLYARRARAALPEEDGGPMADDEAGLERAQQVLRASAEVLTEHESKVVLRGFGIEITRQAVASSASGAAAFAERIGFPVVLKAVSPDLRRKTEVGAVKLGLTNAASVRRGYAAIVANVETNAPTARLDGVSVAEMIQPGIEIHCGAIRMADGGFALYGRPVGGGASTEPVLAACPLSSSEAHLLAHAVLERVPVPALRRASDPEPQVLAALFSSLARIVEATEDRLLSIDLNPIRLLEGERPYVVLDARIVQRPHLEGA
jgi:hypothetical protein